MARSVGKASARDSRPPRAGDVGPWLPHAR